MTMFAVHVVEFDSLDGFEATDPHTVISTEIVAESELWDHTADLARSGLDYLVEDLTERRQALFDALDALHDDRYPDCCHPYNLDRRAELRAELRSLSPEVL